MNKKNKTLVIAIVSLFILLLASFIITTFLIFQGKVYKAFLFIGAFGLVSLIVLHVFLFICRQKRQEPSANFMEYDKDFKAILDKAEVNPDAHLRKLNHLSHLGNIYSFLYVSLVILTLIGVIMIGVEADMNMGSLGYFIAFLIGIAFIIIKSFFIKTDQKPTLYLLTKEEYPLIFKAIEEGAKGKEIGNVYLTGDHIYSVIRMKEGRKTRDNLFIGLSILEILNEEELKAVSAHEFAHINNLDTKLGRKIFINQSRWQKINDDISTKGGIYQLSLGVFSSFFVRELNLYLEALAKKREYKADKHAASVSSPQSLASSLAKIGIYDIYSNELNKDLQARLMSSDDEINDFYAKIFEGFYKQYEANKDSWLSQLKQVLSNKYDSHPSFVDRVKGLGFDEYNEELIFAKDDPAFDEEVKKATLVMNELWKEDMTSELTSFREKLIENKKLIDDFQETDDFEKLMEYGLALEETFDYLAAKDLYDRILAKEPSYTPAIFRKGQILVNEKDASGIDLLKEAADLNSDFIEGALLLIAQSLTQLGLENKKEELKEWALEKHDLYAKKEEELNLLFPKDKFISHGLDQEILDKIIDLLQSVKKLKTAYLVKKELQYNKKPLYVLGLLHTATSTMKIKQENITFLVEGLNSLGLTCFFLDLATNPAFTKPLSKIEGSKIFPQVPQ